NQPTGEVEVNFKNNGTTSNADYTTSNTTVTLGTAFSATAVDDALADSGETFTVSLVDKSYNQDAANTADGSGAYETVTYDKATVTTTILDETANDPADTSDNDSAYTLKLFASDNQGNLLLDDNGNPVDATQIHEDAETSAYYVVKAVDEFGALLADQPAGNVEVNFKNNGTTSNADYTVSSTTVTLGAAFSATAINDALADNGETFTVSLVKGSYSEDAANTSDGSGAYETVTYDDATVTTTIRDLDFAVVEDNKNTQEDGNWNIEVLENLDQIYTGDEFASIKISGIPNNAILKDGDGNPITVTNGSYTLNSWQATQELTLTPAVDSSKDIELSYEVTLTDGSIDTFVQSIVISPEADQPWTLGKLGSETVTYQNTLLEDAGWTALDAGWTDGTNVFNELTASTGDADGSESNTLVRFFTDQDTNLPSGTRLRYEDADGNTQTFRFSSSNTHVDIPADKLDTLQIKTPDNFNGELSLKIKTAVIDRDEDGKGSDKTWSDKGKVDQTWGEADTLTIQVAGSADLSESLISATSVIAPEDSGRNKDTGELIQNADGTYDISEAIDLKINFSQSNYTNTEVIELEIQGIPADAFIFDKSGNLLNASGETSIKIVLDPNGNYTAQAGDLVLTSKGAFNSFVENLKLVPPQDSNEDFTLTLHQTATEPSWDSSVGGSQTKVVTDTFEVQLTGVADNPIVSGVDTPLELTESSDWQDISGFQIASGETQHQSEDVYALIKNLPKDFGLRVVDQNGNELFDQLVLANVNASGATDWRIDNDTLQKINAGDYAIQLKTPEADMSGKLSFGIRVTVLDTDSDAGQETDTLVADYTMNLVVMPKVENYKASKSSGSEDSWIKIGEDLIIGSKDGDTLVEGQYDFNGTSYDLKITLPNLGETGEHLQVKGDNLAIDYSTGTVYLNQNDLDSVEILPPMHSNDDISNIEFHRYLKDSIDDGALDANGLPYVHIDEVVTGHTVEVTGVADGWTSEGFTVVDSNVDKTTDNTPTPLSSIVTNNKNIEDTYHDETPGAGGAASDTSESEYYIVQNQSGADNTSWMIEGAINVGKGIWVVSEEALNSANIKILDFTGDGTLDLQITPVSKENDASSENPAGTLFGDPRDFTIEYTPVTGGGGGDNSLPVIDLHNKNVGLEDTLLTNVLEGTTVSEGATLSYVISNVSNGAVDVTGMYQLPDGSFVGTGQINFDPTDEFNGDAGFTIEVIATGTNGKQASVTKDITLDINPVLDESKVSAEGGTETNAVAEGSAEESIALNIQITSDDTDGSEKLQGDITLTPKDGGSLTGPGVTANADGSYTVSPANLGSVAFVPNAYTHGEYEFGITYTWIDVDANGGANVSETITTSFKITIESQVDQIDVAVTPSTNTINEAEDYPLNLSVIQHDSDGSEMASVRISGIPDALFIQDANGNKIGNYSANSDGTVSVVLKGSEVPTAGGLTLHDTTGTYGGEFKLAITAYSFDKVTKEIEVGSDTVTLSITPVASGITQVDAGSAETNLVIGDEDNAGMPLNLDVIMVDLDGSEKLKITFSDEFADENFTATYTDEAGAQQTLTDTSYLTAAEAQTIKLVPPENYKGKFDLTVKVQTVELDATGNVIDTLATPVEKTVEVTVNPLADQFTIDTAGGSGEEDSSINLGLKLTLEDSSELLNLTLSGYEEGSSFLVDGTLVTGVVDGNSITFDGLTAAQVEAIAIHPPENYSGTMAMEASIKTVDGTAVLNTPVTQTFNLEVTPLADQPDLSASYLSNETDNGDGSFSYDLTLDAALTDASETLTLRLDGIPTNSLLANAAGDTLLITDGSIVLTTDQLVGLKLTTPNQLIPDGPGGLHLEASAISTEDMGTTDTSDDLSALQTNTLIDGVIEGIAYTTTSGHFGFTDSQGSFQYREGDSVTFKVGDLVLGEASPEDLVQNAVFLQDMANVSRADLNDEYVENMAVFIQSLDKDDNADNGITITPEIHAAYEGVVLDLRTATEEEVRDAVELAGKTAITEQQAMDHVQRMLEQYSNQSEFEAHVSDSLNTNEANEFGDPNQEPADFAAMNDLFIFGNGNEQALLDALEKGVEEAPADQNWLSQTEEDQGNSDSLFDATDHSNNDELEPSTYDDQPCGW
ncbi:hypothetical protein, partial [Marinospirillum minutulum]|uniref:hypothetical protein n=1 Tax=Marinospirillum minutulum TaxID=64974 RepID=UPI0004896DF5